jgi:F0F1-type ATP synthase membrane subunit b/b'
MREMALGAGELSLTASTQSASQADALIAEIRHKVALAAQALLDDATREADGIRQAARDKARRQLLRARGELRQAREQHLARATAELDAATRRRDAASARAILAIAWPLLEAALDLRWIDAAARERWIDAALDEASRRLRHGAWVVRVPADLDAAGCEALQRALAQRGATSTTVQPDAALHAGLIVESAGATLDATPRALLADRAEVEAMLLGAIAPRDDR